MLQQARELGTFDPIKLWCWSIQPESTGGINGIILEIQLQELNANNETLV